MGLSNAERQRRYRDRKRAEQQEGLTAVTAPVTPPVTGNDVTLSAPQLGTRGRRLWKQCTDDGAALKPAERVLLEEACRTADRLDTLDRILRGDDDVWLRFRSLNDDGSIVSVVINNALSEARQQQVALKALLAELRTSRAGGLAKPGVGRPVSPVSTSGGGGVAGVTSLAARIAAKRGGQAAG